MSAPAEPRAALRADALRNRERLVEIADATFRDAGIDVPLEVIAKRAKVGIGTLYRHFANRTELLAAALDSRVVGLAEEANALVASPTPGSALMTWLKDLIEYGTTYSGLAGSMGATIEADTQSCIDLERAGSALLARAQSANEVRADLGFGELTALAAGLSLAIQRDGVTDEQKRLLFDVLVRGLRPVGR